jgi:methionyl-tRNA formyltransferase
MGRPGLTPLCVVLLGDGAWATQALTALQGEPHSVVGVLLRTQPSEPALGELAERLRIPVLQPANVNASDTVLAIRELHPDLLLSIAYNQILRAPARVVAPLGALNIHAGKLPWYRGRNVINWALINGESEIGVTAHFMDDGIDTGDILLQRSVPVDWCDTYGDVLQRVVAAVPGLVLESLDLIAAGNPPRRPQRHLPGSYFGGRGEGDEWLDWGDSSVALHNKIRAITHPGPGARTELQGQRVTIWRAFCDPAWPRYIATPGQVVGRDDHGVFVKTGDATIHLERISVENGEEVVPRWPVGTRLEPNRMLAALARDCAAIPREPV